MTAAAFWDDYARHYDAIWDAPVTSAAREAARGLLGEPATLVDLGCGTGLLSAGWARGGTEVVGVDLSEPMLARAVATGRVTRPVVAAAEHVPLPDGCADAVLVGNLLHVHADPAAVLREARRLAAPQAPVVVIWPVPGLTADRMLRLDLASGRGVRSALRAHLLRMRVGVRGLRAGGAVAARARGGHDSRGLEAVVGAEHPRADAGLVAGCQRVVAL